MSKFLNDISTNSISLEEGLQRLLIIANKTNNQEVAAWCISELNGYNHCDILPKYRMFKSRNIIYSGINGTLKVKNITLGLGFLSKETLSKIENINIRDNIAKVEENKNNKEIIYRDLTPLSSEVYSNTTSDEFPGVQCTEIKQLIPNNYYSLIYFNVKTRVINLLCSYESANLDIDELDIKRTQIKIIEENNEDIYKTVISDGTLYTFVPKEKKILWNIIIPIITGIIGSVVSGVLVYLITKI